MSGERLDERRLKWLIARAGWACAARMHAAIAAASSGVPVATLAYSDKASGVLATCGLAGDVADLRTLDARALVDAVWRSRLSRDAGAASLQRALPGVMDRAGEQMRRIGELLRDLAYCRSLARGAA